VRPTPLADAGNDRTLLEGESLIIEAKGQSNSSYSWQPEQAIENNKVLKPKVYPIEDVFYRLEVKGDNGCIGTDEMLIKILKTVKVPTAFSPNGDGINDTWRIENLSAYAGATVEVFNRLGQQVYYSNGYSREWDGSYKNKPLLFGTYYWIITPKNGRKQMTGNITLIR
jgi:gliding motility-associated-like protein